MDIRVVKSEKEKEDAFQVRRTVFVDEQHVPEEEEIDEFEEEAVHFVAYADSEGEKPVGAGRLRILDDIGKVERICVLKEFRTQGVGDRIMQKIEEEAERHPIEELKLNAQVQAERFYKRLGYETISGEFFDAGIPHVAMRKIPGKTPS
ncbi:GNAT family N-acetyltransferase [Alteribacter natronophilus]|uniref:GNAT family N-acetyltransferase n=1 Tax=Alteribacter natronophilus TaxID=2583810 RepID=UPI00110F58BF|nr:GNAT family N-acetyltransferase [Alteribacter natronophilus]TMW72981.1 GNAT family N-acetyltransferase [Alteribacter natronophilus]